MKKVSTEALDALLRQKEDALTLAEARFRESEAVYNQRLAEVEQLTADIADLKTDLGKPL